MPGSCKVTNLARHPRAPDLPDLELDLSSTRVLIYPLSVGPCRAVSPARRVAALALAPSALHIYPMWWCPPSFGALSLSSLSFPARSASRAAALVRAGSCLPAPSVRLCLKTQMSLLYSAHARARTLRATPPTAGMHAGGTRGEACMAWRLHLGLSVEYRVGSLFANFA